MRYFSGYIVVLFFIYTGCSSTEPVQKKTDKQPEPVIKVESSVPAWYQAGVSSSSDSLNVYGYALASAADSSEAVELSTDTALENLRFEIDKWVENARKNLADSAPQTEEYSSGLFIIKLRKTVSALPLNSVEFTRTHDLSEAGIHYSYTRTDISRTDLFSLLETHVDNSQLVNELEKALM